jgi:CHAD domain-containing protein
MTAVTLGPDVAATKETGPFAAENASRLLRRFAYHAGRVAKAPHADDVHHLRVAVRRFTQALTAFDSCFPAQELKNIKRRLKKIMGLAGDVRDCDIAIDLLSRSKAAPAALLATFRDRRKGAERELAGALRRWTQRHSYSKWEAALKGPNRGAITHDPIAMTAWGVLEPMLLDLLARGTRTLKHKAPAEKTHRVRIAAKKLRYALELFAPVHGASLDGWVEKIAALQGVLGTISDCETVRTMIEREGGDRKVEASLQRKARRKLDEFRLLWAEAFTRASIQALVAQIGPKPPRKPAAQIQRRAPEPSQLRATHA